MAPNNALDQLTKAVEILQKIVTDTNPDSVMNTYQSIHDFLGSPELKTALIAEKVLVCSQKIHEGYIIPVAPSDFKLWPESSTITKTAYFEKPQHLIIHFKTGSVYQYLNFPPDQWELLKSCISIGKFFNASVNKKYESMQIIF